MSAIKEFKEFILRGNVVDLAVGVVVGGAFGAVVKALVSDIVTPLIGIPGHVNFSDLTYSINGSKFLVGDFINSVVGFVLIAFVIFFLVVRPVNWLMSRRKTEVAADPETRECPECLSKIPAAARRCAFCTAIVPAAEAAG